MLMNFIWLDEFYWFVFYNYFVGNVDRGWERFFFFELCVFRPINEGLSWKNGLLKLQGCLFDFLDGNMLKMVFWSKKSQLDFWTHV